MALWVARWSGTITGWLGWNLLKCNPYRAPSARWREFVLAHVRAAVAMDSRRRGRGAPDPRADGASVNDLDRARRVLRRGISG